MNDLTGKTVIITGASSGIGEACADLMAELGANLMLLARRAERLETIAKRLREVGARVETSVCDVAVRAQVDAAFEKAIGHFGRVDILVNNAGTMTPIGHLGEVDPDLWADAIDINVKGVFNAMRAGLPPMLEQGAGTIINMSSGAVNSALEGWSHYCASKAAARKLTEVGHKEYGSRGITIVGLSPGTVATPMMDQIRESGMNPVSQLDPSVHIPPEWAARAVVFLCGDGGRQFAGTDFSIKTEEGRALVGLPPLG
ncbi:SDR family oxidoreductase [uncultured Erythrobacter sp.]|uniref:SDR family oxidoreductase n=1 Tax=uncultured Erythrobacter sp. TaxID=263913 RepID=UPI0026043EE6|nr:SDR family oxidoreductase [uncultured Erythrobacter sp.]